MRLLFVSRRINFNIITSQNHAAPAQGGKEMMHYEYLISMAAVGILIWLPLYLWRKDLRKPMLWSGLFYITVTVIWFAAVRVPAIILSLPAHRTLTPGYWEPQTLLGIGRATAGLAIEDIFFMFFVGGVAAVLYEYCFHWRIAIQRSNHQHHWRAIALGLLVALATLFLFPFNVMYTLIALNAGGAVAIWAEREDLIPHSLLGGILMLSLYTVLFYVFTLFFPEFVARAYHPENVSGVLFIGIPLEEFMYAFSFGLFWAPIYEYEHGAKNSAVPVKNS